MKCRTKLDKGWFLRDVQIDEGDIIIVKISGIIVQHNTKRHYF
jgi:hypothetical protein